MARVTPTEVKEIVTTSLDDAVVSIWIDAASAIVDDNAVCINKDEAGLTQVELYLSAHFVAMLDPSTRGYVTKTKFDVMETDFSKPAEVANSIDNTTYGTTANMLSNGCLANADKASVSLCAVGGD